MRVTLAEMFQENHLFYLIISNSTQWLNLIFGQIKLNILVSLANETGIGL